MALFAASLPMRLDLPGAAALLLVIVLLATTLGKLASLPRALACMRNHRRALHASTVPMRPRRGSGIGASS